MSLRYKLRKAQTLLETLTPEERTDLVRICETIRQSQVDLLANAGPAMQQCLRNCEGLCCRNARVDDIIGLWDLVYILTLTPELEDDMATRVERESPFYSANCMFLKEDTGPCIFVATIRPEVCVTTFCSGDGAIQKEIRRVKRHFFKIGCFFFWRRTRAILAWLSRPMPRSGPSAAAPSRDDRRGRRFQGDRSIRGEKHG